MTTFVAISDTHNRHEEIDVPNADIVFHAGDSTGTGTTRQIREFAEWFGKLPHKHKILIAGNHDWGFQYRFEECKQICEDNGIIYLQDSGCEIEGIKIYGSPYTPEFCDWAFNCWRTEKQKDLDYGPYNKGYEYIGKFWDMIPLDTDIVLTHGPVYDILDDVFGRKVGCEVLKKKIEEIKPSYHICGHIHCAVGDEKYGETQYINASTSGENYKPNGNEIKIWTIGEEIINPIEKEK